MREQRTVSTTELMKSVNMTLVPPKKFVGKSSFKLWKNNAMSPNFIYFVTKYVVYTSVKYLSRPWKLFESY